MKLHIQHRLGHPATRHTILIINRALLICAVILGLGFSLGAAEVTTDQTEYAPGTTAFITGTGFAAGEWVVLRVLHADGTPGEGEDHEPWTVPADASGGFLTSWHVCEDDCVDSTLQIIAVGQSSSLQAQATFTDASFFGLRLISVTSLSGGCTRTLTTSSNAQVFIRPGQTYRFNFSLNTNGVPPACFTTTNSSGPPAIVLSLGSNFGNATMVARRVGIGPVYTNNFVVPSGACGDTPITFTCDSGSTQQVLFNTVPPDRPIQLRASLDCSNVLSCTSSSNQLPTISCVNNVVNSSTGACSAAVNYALPGATGTPTPTVTCTPPPGSTFPIGGTLVTCTASNSVGIASCVFTLTVRSSISCPGNRIVSTSPGQCSAVVSYAAGGPTNCPGVTFTCFPASGSTFPRGATVVICTARDASGNSNTCSFVVNVVDTEPPTIVSCAPPITVSAGDGCQAAVPDVTGSVVASDNCTPAQSLIISQNPAAGTMVGLGATAITITVRDTGTNNVTTNAPNNASQCMTTFTVVNSAPVISNITGPTGPLALGGPASVTVDFTDADSTQTHTVVFDWDDGSSDAVALAAGVATTTLSHTYSSAGVYSVTVTVNDPCTSVSKVLEFIVVYNPEGGFVTGGGWIDSPAGAFTADPSLTGKANFGFVSKYEHGANVPTGETEFQFKAGDLNFHSTDYQWLVISGAKAQYKGTGTINGAGGYSFRLTATDGQANGGGGVDKFRIKISGPGGVVYDNVVGGSDDIDAANPQALGGGSIVIHH